MVKKNDVKGHRIIIDNHITVMKPANALTPGMSAAIVPKNRITRIAAINAKIACIEDVINVNGAARMCLISLISTIFSPPFTISKILFLVGDILIFRF